MKRFIVDWVGNFVFFVPIVTLFAGFLIPAALGQSVWTWSIWLSYALGSFFIAAVGGRGFTVFLKYWYRLFKEEF